MNKFIRGFLAGLFLGCAVENTAALPDAKASDKAQTVNVESGALTKKMAVAAAPSIKSMRWTDENGALNANGQILLRVLKDSWMHGLNPDNYSVKEIQSPAGADSYQEREQLLTDALVKYAQDMTGPRVDPAIVLSRAEFWRKPLTRKTILYRFSQTKDFESELRNLEPKAPLYKALQQELQSLVNKPQRAQEPVSLKGAKLQPGKSHKAVPKIRAYFGLPKVTGPAMNVYDTELHVAVKEFQQRAGLEPDGVIGQATLDQMNMRNKDKIRQLIVNLERLRWDERRPASYVEVNIATQKLDIIRDGQKEREMTLIVGRHDRQTVEFKAKMTGVRFNPFWSVPISIMNADKIPALRKNPYTFEDEGIFVYRKGKRIDSGSINWKNITEKELKDIRLIQQPGAENALGQIRILMANPDDQYLHHTNQPELFKKRQRFLSSGCIRMEEPRVIAEFVLSEGRGLPEGEIEKHLAKGANNDVKAPQPVMFYSVYRTTTLGDEGQIIYRTDIYKRDKDIYDALQKKGQVFAPPGTIKKPPSPKVS